MPKTATPLAQPHIGNRNTTRISGAFPETKRVPRFTTNTQMWPTAAPPKETRATSHFLEAFSILKLR